MRPPTWTLVKDLLLFVALVRELDADAVDEEALVLLIFVLLLLLLLAWVDSTADELVFFVEAVPALVLLLLLLPAFGLLLDLDAAADAGLVLAGFRAKKLNSVFMPLASGFFFLDDMMKCKGQCKSPKR